MKGKILFVAALLAALPACAADMPFTFTKSFQGGFWFLAPLEEPIRGPIKSISELDSVNKDKQRDYAFDRAGKLDEIQNHSPFGVERVKLTWSGDLLTKATLFEFAKKAERRTDEMIFKHDADGCLNYFESRPTERSGIGRRFNCTRSFPPQRQP